MPPVNTLLVDSVQLAFGRLQVLQSVFITARTGRVTGVLGRNGTGKSCLFKSIMGGIKPQNIFIRFNEERDTDYGHIGNRIKYLPQHEFIPAKMTLGEAYTLYGVDYDGLVSFDPKFHTYQRRMARELSGGEVRVHSPKFHTYQRRMARELSGGEVRVAEMYMILHAEAEFCILDEPFSNIAPKYVEKMQLLIQEQKASKGIIVSDHLYESVISVTDDLFLLRDGFTFPVKSRDDLVRLGYILR